MLIIKVALMQPYFFPYIGYYQLINAVDEFVIFDNAQYIRRGWINRNQILNAQNGHSFINIPVIKAPRETKIKDSMINNTINWQEKMLKQLSYYKSAPYFNEVLDFIQDCFSYSGNNLCDFNTLVIRKTCNLLAIETTISILSQKFPSIDEANHADEWGIKVTKALNATTYMNAIGGKEFYSQQKYEKYGLNLQFTKPNLTPYKQFQNPFIAGLSIIDVMMFNDLEKIKGMLEIHENQDESFVEV